MIQRPVPWPGGAKCAVFVTFDMDADSILHIAHPKDSLNRMASMSSLRNQVQTITGTEVLPLNDAIGRVLAKDQLAVVDVPPAANSAMDGFALKAIDLINRRELRISQRIAAGCVPIPLEKTRLYVWFFYVC